MAKKLMKGCEAVAEAAIQAGCHYFFGYPITPQNDIPEYMARPSSGGRLLPPGRERSCCNQHGLRRSSCRCKVHDKLLQPRNQP